jgi:hypothetical protein
VCEGYGVVYTYGLRRTGYCCTGPFWYIVSCSGSRAKNLSLIIMDKFLALIDIHTLTQVLAGTFDIDKIPVNKHKSIFIMASHCCLNGPVGTNKVTTFPTISGDVSISGYIGSRVSNNSWKSFCKEVCDILSQNYHDVVIESQQLKVAGGLWPVFPSISEFRKSGAVV